MEPDVCHPEPQFIEGIDQRLDILDGSQPDDGSDINPAIRLFQRDVAEAFVMDPVCDHAAALRGAADLNLGLPGVVKQAGDHGCLAVYGVGQHVEKAHPEPFEGGGNPSGSNDLFFPFPGIDPVFRQHERGVVFIASQPGHQAAVASGNGMVEIRLRDILADGIQHGKEHGTQRMEHVGKRRIGIVLLADPDQDIEEFLTGQKGHGRYFLIVVHFKEHLPVRALTMYEICQRLQLLSRKFIFFSVGGKLQGVLQEDFLYFHDVFRQFVLELPSVLGGSANGQEHEFMLWHGLDILVHPGGHAAGYIRVAPFKNDTDTHVFPLFFVAVSGSYCRFLFPASPAG